MYWFVFSSPWVLLVQIGVFPIFQTLALFTTRALDRQVSCRTTRARTGNRRKSRLFQVNFQTRCHHCKIRSSASKSCKTCLDLDLDSKSALGTRGRGIFSHVFFFAPFCMSRSAVLSTLEGLWPARQDPLLRSCDRPLCYPRCGGRDEHQEGHGDESTQASEGGIRGLPSALCL